MKHKLSVGVLLSATLQLIGDSLSGAALYVLVVGGMTAAGVAAGLTETSAMTMGFGFQISTDSGLAGSLVDLAITAVSIVGSYLLLVRYLGARGRLQAGGGRFWPYVGMSILSVIGIVIGFILLIVPGFILLVRWSAASGFLIEGREGVADSLGASWRATDGQGWTIFGAAFVLFIAAAIVGAVIGGLLGLASDQAASIASAFAETAATAAFLAFGIAVYRSVHDDAAQLSEVFA